MHFVCRNGTRSRGLHLARFARKTQSSVSLLGLVPHLRATLKKTKLPLQTIRFLSQKNTKCPAKVRIHLYKCLIRPLFTYATPLLINYNQSQLEKLCLEERRILKTCLKLPKTTPNILVYALAGLKPLPEYLNLTNKKYITRALNKPTLPDMLHNPHPDTILHKLALL